MAEKIKNTPNAPSKKAQSRRTSDRRKQIATIVMMVSGFLILLGILAYARADEPVLDKVTFLDVFRLPFDAHVKAITGEIHNRFGLLGALISDVFVNDTIGYASILFPCLMLMWGWIILTKKEVRKPLTFTNYSIIVGLLLSTAFGVANRVVGDIDKEWSGSVGAFCADVMTRLLGSVGASIVVLASLFITVILAIDLDIHKSLERASHLWAQLMEWYARRQERVTISTPEDEDGVDVRDAQEEEESEEEEPVRRPDVIVRPLEDGIDPLEEEQGEGDDRPMPAFTPARKASAPLPDRPPTEPVESAEAEVEEIDYVFPSVELLDPPRQTDTVDDAELKANAELVRTKLARFGVEIESVSVMPGPVITLYELVPASGVKISRIVALADDLALALAARGIRIIAPIPGKSAVGVEIPNKNPSMVYIRSILNSAKFRESKSFLPVALGKTISGEALIDDLTKMPHLLIAGATGSGKSVGINTLLAGLLYRLHPSDVKFIIIDPKKIELTPYAKLKYHFLAVSPDLDEEIITTPENAVSILKSVELEMEKRYDRLAAAGVRNIQDYNERLISGRLKNSETIVHRKMPYLVVVIDELADLMMTAAREVEEPIARLAQLARAVGIHLILATQRPSVDVITGVIKANFPARIAYQVASKTDSRTILDMNGADQLLGNGDMLFLPSGSPKPSRIQNAFISTDEVERLTEHIAKQKGYSRPFQLPSILEKKRAGMRGAANERDEFFEEAARLIVRHQQGSVSLLQRRLKVGYSRAARLVDELESAGIVGPFDGSKARLVLVDSDDQLDRILGALEG